MNKKGFVLMETLVVTIFALFIFTILYNSVVPLLGKYHELSYYDDLDTTYDLYYLRNLIANDPNYNEIKSNKYLKLTCSNLENKDDCNTLFEFLEIDSNDIIGTDEVIFLNTNYIDDFKNDENISIDVKNYLKYKKVEGNILLLQKDGYISYIKKMNASDIIKNAIAEKAVSSSSCKTTVVKDGITYIAGKKECIDFNYVWYSGKLWRVTALYPDGSMKMITDDVITTINWGATSTGSSTDLTNAYSTSWIREWLNQEFLPTLYNYENIIVEDAGWYSIPDSASTPTKPTGEYTLTDPVGLLNAYEYYMSYRNTSNQHGYLNIGYYWWLITPINYVHNIGGTNSGGNGFLGVRPSINLKSIIEFNGGSGTSEDPYRIKGDIEEATANTTLLNTRYSGEYVKLENDDSSRLFRIVNKELVGENLTTKLVLNDYIKESDSVLKKQFSNSSTLWSEVDNTDVTYLRGYLNTTWLGTLDTSMLEKGIYYLGYNEEGSYKTTVCSIVNSDISIKECIEKGTVVSNTSSDDYVGLLRVGEMFASQTSDYTYIDAEIMSLITPDSSSLVRGIVERGFQGNSYPFQSSAARPTINLKSNIVIKSGSGTVSDPFVVGLP